MERQGTAGEGTLVAVVDTRNTNHPPIHVPAARGMVPKIIAALLSPASHFGIQPVADPTGVFIYSLPATLAGPILDT
eukprot:594583-Prorocentrum_lima.AAC.1